MQGVSVDSTMALAKNTEIPVIASGGVGSIADLHWLLKGEKEEGVKLEGVISGRALYDGRLDPAEALEVLRDA